MSSEDTTARQPDPQEELRRLRLENKKLARELRTVNDILQRTKKNTIAQNHLNTIMAAEKTQQENSFNVFLQYAPDIILLLDNLKNVVFCTRSFLTAAQLPNADFVNSRPFAKVMQSLVGPAQTAALDALVDEILFRREPAATTLQLDFGGTGHPRDYQIHLAPASNVAAQLGGVLLIFTDTTELIEQKEKAEAANRAKSDFLARMSHEIRTPMNAVIGITDILSRSDLDAQQKEHVHSIKRSSSALLNLINDILDFSKIEAGKMELACDWFDLQALLHNLHSFFLLMFENKGLQFSFSMAADVPRAAYGDEYKVRQVITNLLNNALKYTRQGWARLDVGLDAEGAVEIRVSDSGIGIRPEDTKRLFNPFSQLDTVKNKNVVGTGLGLAITSNLCTLMDGSIGVNSTYGEGSVFTVRLPLQTGGEDKLPLGDDVQATFTVNGGVVLVVDDIDINLIIAESLLEMYGVRCVLANSGEKALEQVKKRKFDIVFMDHMMPGMDGIEATKAIRAMGGPYEQVPIVALTANAIVGAREMFIDSGFSDFLPKPIDNSQVSSCVLKWMPKEKVEFIDAPVARGEFE